MAGGRGFYLKDEGVLLNLALINYGLAFLRKRGFKPMQTPFFMRKETMGKCAQLAQFDEELYKRFVDHIVVYSKSEIGFAMKCGPVFRERIG